MDEETDKEIAKAVQEVSKLAQLAIDPAVELGKAISQNEIGDTARAVFALVGGYAFTEWGLRNFIIQRQRTLDILAERNIQIDPNSIRPRFGLKWMRASVEQDEPEIQELMAKLLARAMDKDFTHDVRDRFIDIVSTITPADARLLRQLYADKPFVDLGGYSVRPGLMECDGYPLDHLQGLMDHVLGFDTEDSFEQLACHGCIARSEKLEPNHNRDIMPLAVSNTSLKGSELTKILVTREWIIPTQLGRALALVLTS